MTETISEPVILTEFVPRSRIAYVLKSYCKEMGGLFENKSLSKQEMTSLKARQSTVENFLRAYANFNVSGDFHTCTYERNVGACDYRYYPNRHQGVVSLPKDVKNALLTDMVDIDTKSSNPNYMIQTCHMQDVPCPTLEDYFANKAKYHLAVKQAYGMSISEKACKQLFLSMINGGTFAGWVVEHSKTTNENPISGFTAGDNLQYYDCDDSEKVYRKLRLGEENENETKKRKFSKPKVEMIDIVKAFATEMVDICCALRNKGCNKADWSRAAIAAKGKNKPTAMGTFMYLFMIRAEAKCIMGTIVPYLLKNGYATWGDICNFLIYEWDGIKLKRSIVEAKGGVQHLITVLQNLVEEVNGYRIVLEEKPMETCIDMDQAKIDAMAEEEIEAILGGAKSEFDHLYSRLKRMTVPNTIADFLVETTLKGKVYKHANGDAKSSIYVYCDNNYGIRDTICEGESMESVDNRICRVVIDGLSSGNTNHVELDIGNANVLPARWEYMEDYCHSTKCDAKIG